MKHILKQINKKRALKVVALAAIMAAIAASAISFGVVRPVLSKGNTEVITNEAPAVSVDTREVKKEADINPFAGRFVTYEGLTGVAAQGKAFLVNPEDNDEDIYIEFVVSENEDVLYSSDLVPSGQGLDVDFSEFLSAGDHEVVVTMNPYVLYEGEYLRCPVNNAQSVKVTL